MFSQAEILQRFLDAIGLWPPEDYESPWDRIEIRGNLIDAMEHLDDKRLIVVVWIATLLAISS